MLCNIDYKQNFVDLQMFTIIRDINHLISECVFCCPIFDFMLLAIN